MFSWSYYAASFDNFLQTFRDNLTVPSSGVNNPKGLDSWPLMMGPTGCPETSVRNYHHYYLSWLSTPCLRQQLHKNKDRSTPHPHTQTSSNFSPKAADNNWVMYIIHYCNEHIAFSAECTLFNKNFNFNIIYRYSLSVNLTLSITV